METSRSPTTETSVKRPAPRSSCRVFQVKRASVSCRTLSRLWEKQFRDMHRHLPRIFRIESHECFIFSGSVPSVGPCMRVQLGRRGNVVSDRHMGVSGVRKSATLALTWLTFGQIVRCHDPAVGVANVRGSRTRQGPSRYCP
jgi:hypothetical protein